MNKNEVNSTAVTKSEMRRIMTEMKAPEYANGVNKEFCATCGNLVFCGMLQREILSNRSKGKPEPRQLPLVRCINLNFKNYVHQDNNIL